MFTIAADMFDIAGLSGTSQDGGVNHFTSKTDPANPIDGAPSLLVTGASGNSPTNCAEAAYGHDLDASYVGKRLRMRQEVKTDNVASVNLEFSIGLLRYGNATNSGVYDDMKIAPDRTIRGTTPWQEVALVLDVPTPVDRLSAEFMVCGTGRAWFGPVTIEVVPKTVPTTPHVTWVGAPP